MALADNALTTIDQVKTVMEIDSSDTTRDSIIEYFINSCSAEIENECGRKFGLSTHFFSSTIRSDAIYLDEYPITEIVSITENGATLTTADYTLKPNSGTILRPFRGLVAVEYKAGYALPKDDSPTTPRTLPFDLENACISYVMYCMTMKDAAGLSSYKEGELQWNYTRNAVGVNIYPMPIDVLGKIGPYTRCDLV